MMALLPGHQVFAYAGPVDVRKGYDSLAALVEQGLDSGTSCPENLDSTLRTSATSSSGTAPFSTRTKPKARLHSRNRALYDPSTTNGYEDPASAARTRLRNLAISSAASALPAIFQCVS